MNLSAPAITFYVLTVIAVVAWICALEFMLLTSRRQKSTAERESELAQLGTAAPMNLIVGSAEVAGNPAELAGRAAAYLAKQGPLTLGPVKIVEQTGNRVAFEGAPGISHGGGRLFARGEFQFTLVGTGRTRVDYAIDVPPRSWLLTLGWLFVGLGLAAIVLGGALIQFLVLDAGIPAVEWQSVQIIHAGHFIWPPFLFGGIYRRIRSHLRTTFDSIAHNLPYYEA